MKKTITLILLCFAMVSQLAAQGVGIPEESPVPVEVRMEASDGQINIFNYGKPATWCDTLLQTVSGDLVWAYGLNDSLLVQGDTLLCDSMVFNDLSGKIALIRRGECEFGWKSLRAQEAGAIGVVIINRLFAPEVGSGTLNMGGGAVGAQVHIPVVLLSAEDGDILLDKIVNGVAVNMVFDVIPFGGARTAYSYQTPLVAVRPLEDISVSFVNTSETDVIPSVTIGVEITNPSGQTTSLSKVITDLPVKSLNKADFDDPYTPTEVGTYTVKFTNSLTADEVERQFVISDDFTFALDNGNIVTNTNGTIEPDSANFVSQNSQYDFGNVYRTGPNPVVATHASFMISNPDELYTGDEDSDKFFINLFNADPDGNGSIPYPAELPTYASLNESGGPLIPLAQSEYVLQEGDQGFELITVAFNNPATLPANGMYLLMVQYNGVGNGLGIPPKYAFAGQERVAGEVGNMVYDDSLHTDGWGTNYNGVIRLHLDGYVSSTDEALADGKMSLSPNPVSQTVNLELDLDEVATEVEVRILDFTGRLVLSTRTLENVQSGRFGFDVGHLANGAYFMSITTPEGFRSRKFQVLR